MRSIGRPRVVFDTDTSRICIDCKELCSIERFVRNPKVSGGYNRNCKKCAVIRARELRNKKKLQAIEYKGGECSKCGGTFIPDVYDFHHRDSKEKEYSINYLRKRGWEEMKKELDKCDLLCANCHRIVHANMREEA